MSDVYIRNRHGVVHSIPEDVWPVARSQGATKISREEFDKIMAEQQTAKEPDQGETKPAPAPAVPEPEPDAGQQPEPEPGAGKAKAKK